MELILKINVSKCCFYFDSNSICTHMFICVRNLLYFPFLFSELFLILFILSNFVQDLFLDISVCIFLFCKSLQSNLLLFDICFSLLYHEVPLYTRYYAFVLCLNVCQREVLDYLEQKLQAAVICHAGAGN